jgi:hypothetical protein
MKNPKHTRPITLQEFENIDHKMTFYNMSQGYIGFFDDKIELFVSPCERATALITHEQVKDQIKKLNPKDHAS